MQGMSAVSPEAKLGMDLAATIIFALAAVWWSFFQRYFAWLGAWAGGRALIVARVVIAAVAIFNGITAYESFVAASRTEANWDITMKMVIFGVAAFLVISAFVTFMNRR